MHLCQGLTPRSNEPMADSSFSNNKSVDLSRRFAVWRGGVARQGEMRPDVYQLTTPPPLARVISCLRHQMHRHALASRCSEPFGFLEYASTRWFRITWAGLVSK